MMLSHERRSAFKGFEPYASNQSVNFALVPYKQESNMMKPYALLISFLLCGNALAFEGNTNVAGGTVNVSTGAEVESISSYSSPANRVSKPGEYTGYSDAIYDDKYELTSQYIQMSDGTKLAM